jgi:hypothetical protein
MTNLRRGLATCDEGGVGGHIPSTRLTDSILNPEAVQDNPTLGADQAGAGHESQAASAPSPQTSEPAVNLVLERELMARILVKWGEAIETACASSSVPHEFLAALIANESGGHLGTKPRFELQVFRHLLDVQAGKPSQADLLHHRPAHYGAITPRMLAGKDENTLRAYSTSWGLTQIMGYHVLGTIFTVGDLMDPKKNLAEAIHMLAAFCRQFSLEPCVEFEEMFRCWNAGSPRGKTYDPQYVENGLRRLVIYRDQLAPGVPVTDVASGDL